MIIIEQNRYEHHNYFLTKLVLQNIYKMQLKFGDFQLYNANF